MKDTLNILIGGEAGQGLVTVGQILSRALVRSGCHIVVTQSYQSRIRGGHNTFAVRVGVDEIAAPQESVDLLVAMDENTVSHHRHELSPGGCIIASAAFKLDNYPCILRVPFKELAPEERQANVAALGVAAAMLGLDEEAVAKTVDDFFGKKKPQAASENRAALAGAFRWAAQNHPPSFKKLSAPRQPSARIMLNGNEAIALGVLSAGVRFAAFYPMTPSTSINLTLIAHAKKMGVVVEQAEDEIAAVNMAIGASFAGAPAMAATSGGGFALMVEGVSLAGITETPLVIVVAQRPGPATGLPTRTEQADLEFVLHAAHGEFPRAVFTPGDLTECFFLTRKAFALAEHFQTPVFILTDQFLADSYREVVPFPVDGLDFVKPGAKESEIRQPYRRYEVTESGVSPRLLPGMTSHLVVADSDEHTEDGHLTEDLAARVRQNEKRLRKFDGIRAEVVAPVFTGDEKPDTLLLSWGSTKGAAREAADNMRERGGRVASLHFPQVWPLAPEQFMHHLHGAGRVICVEGNANGQLARLIRRETSFHIERRVFRYDGLPMTPEYILRALERI